MHRENWDDLRYVLAVAQNGSVSAAARALGVNHATVLRRIAAFEHRHGREIFDKTPRGYSLPSDRSRLMDAAREAEAAMLAVSRILQGVQTPLSGTVRVTSTDSFCHQVLPGIVADLRRQSNGLQIDLICSNAHLDLARLDADVAVRPAASMAEDLVGDVAARLGFAVYSVPDVSDDWLGLTGAISRSTPAVWLSEAISQDRIAASGDSFISLREMAALGLGRAILPCVVGDADQRLVRLDIDLPDLTVDIWVASHADLAQIPRIRAVRGHLRDALAEQGARLLGQVNS